MTTETRIGWQDYVAIILRRRWFFAIPAVAIVVGAMVTGVFLPKVYRAETLLLVQDQQVINPLIQGLAVSTPSGERMRVLREELLSWTALSRLATELKFDRQARSPLEFERLIKRLQQDIRVGMRGRDLITIVYEDHDPKLAQRLVGTLTTIYMDRNVESQSAEAETAISFLESELAVYQKKLEDSERALREFKELYVMQMPVATQLNQQTIELDVTLAQLLIENTEAHPRVIETRRQIQELKAKRNEEIKRVIASALVKGHDPKLYADLAQALEGPPGVPEASYPPTIRAAKEAYQAWVNRLDSPMAEAPSPMPQVQVVAATSGQPGGGGLEIIGGGNATSLSLAPRQEQELARLARDYDVNAGTYQHLQERLERAKITQRLGESDEGAKFKILEPARLPLRPVRPNLPKIFFFALFLGVCVGAAVAFVAEYLDQSFQAAEDAQQSLGLPVLGTISTIVTAGDLQAQQTRRKQWVSPAYYQDQLARVKTAILQPLWARVDQLLVRWGL